MARVDERDDLYPAAAARPTRTHRWILPVLGAVLGFVLGTAVASLAAAYMPEGSSAFTGLGLTMQVIGALLGLFAGGLLARPAR